MTRHSLIDWAERQHTGLAGRKLLLLMLARRADEHHACDISEDDLGALLECTPRNVRKLVTALVDLGLIAVQRRSRDTNVYTLLAGDDCSPEPQDPVEGNPETSERNPGTGPYRLLGFMGTTPQTPHPVTAVPAPAPDPPDGYSAPRSSRHAVAFITDVITRGRLTPDRRQFATLARQTDRALRAGYTLPQLRHILTASLAGARDAVRTLIWRLKPENLHRSLHRQPAASALPAPPAAPAHASAECRDCARPVRLTADAPWDGICRACRAPEQVATTVPVAFSWRSLVGALCPDRPLFAAP